MDVKNPLRLSGAAAASRGVSSTGDKDCHGVVRPSSSFFGFRFQVRF